MTGDLPPDDKLAADDDELEAVDAGAADDEDELDDELDENGLVDDSGRTPAAPTPFPESRASQRTSGATRPAVVPQSKAVRAAGDEEYPYIDDRVSKYWIGAIAAVFLLILLYGLLFGKAGMFSPPPPTEEPIPTETPAPSLTLAPSTSPSAVPTITLAPSSAPSAAPTAAASSAPSGVQSAAPASATPGT